MTATLRLTRSFRVADLARPYHIMLDGDAIGTIRTRERSELEIDPGTHTLQLRVPKILDGRPGLASPPVTLAIEESETVAFVCHPPKFTQASWPKYIACLLGRREWWVELERIR